MAIDFAKMLAPFLTFILRLKMLQLAIDTSICSNKLKKLQADLAEAESAVTPGPR